MKPLLSLVVLGFRNFDATTRLCLESLVPWFDDPGIEVLLLDNGSPDDSAQKSLDWCAVYPSVKCLCSATNRGFSGGMNWGAAQASGQWLLLVNNDTIFPAGTLDALKRVIREAPADVAMLGPVTNAAGNGQRLWKPGATQNEWLSIAEWLHDHPSHQLMPAYRCDFFCIAIRRDVWVELSGLDPIFGLGYYEDFDFSLRLAKAGYQQMITEDVLILHTGSATFKNNPSAKALMKSNKKLLKNKHPDARFEHVRLGNFAVLQAYTALKSAGHWTPALEARYQLRIGALEGDAPRSLFKKWRWKRKIARYLSAIASGAADSTS
ncbi:putative glycosyl transferase [mine drainage metagenome]|uniref:Putative glycosyl transferase n=1 Tax=mine drainage metagenome TaxID=410659 RepID=A0A1J5PW14_9ZZZZ